MLFASVSCTKSCNPTIRETSLLLLEKTNRITNLAGVVGIRFVYHILYLGLGRILSSEKNIFVTERNSITRFFSSPNYFTWANARYEYAKAFSIMASISRRYLYRKVKHLAWGSTFMFQHSNVSSKYSAKSMILRSLTSRCQWYRGVCFSRVNDNAEIFSHANIFAKSELYSKML